MTNPYLTISSYLNRIICGRSGWRELEATDGAHYEMEILRWFGFFGLGHFLAVFSRNFCNILVENCSLASCYSPNKCTLQHKYFGRRCSAAHTLGSKSKHLYHSRISVGYYLRASLYRHYCLVSLSAPHFHLRHTAWDAMFERGLQPQHNSHIDGPWTMRSSSRAIKVVRRNQSICGPSEYPSSECNMLIFLGQIV